MGSTVGGHRLFKVCFHFAFHLLSGSGKSVLFYKPSLWDENQGEAPFESAQDILFHTQSERTVEN